MTRVLILLAGVASMFAFGTYSAFNKSTGFILWNLVIAAVCLSGAFYLALKTSLAPTREHGGELLSCIIKGTVVTGLWLSIVIFMPKVSWDLRPTSALPISSATHGIVTSLDSTIEGLLYRAPGDPRISHTRRLLKSINLLGSFKFNEKILSDLDKDRGIFSNTLVLKIRGQEYVLNQPNEGAIYEALVKARPGPKAKWIVGTGFGEGNTLETGPSGYSGLREALKTEGHSISNWIAGIGEPIPEDTKGIVLLNPERSYPPESTRQISRFLEKGGRAAVFVKPAKEQPLKELLDAYGVKVSKTPVMDPDAPRPPVDRRGLLIQRYSRHPIVRDLEVGHATFFPFSAALTLRKVNPMDQLSGLAFTGINGWTKHSQTKGDFLPLTAAIEVERRSTNSKIVIFGDSDFISNRWLRSAYNLDLVLNSFAWLIEDEQLIALRAKAISPSTRQDPVSLGDGLQSFLNVGLIVPELFLMFSALAWIRQKSIGSQLSAR